MRLILVGTALFCQAGGPENWETLWRQLPMVAVMMAILWAYDRRASEREKQATERDKGWQSLEVKRSDALQLLGDSCHKFQMDLQAQSNQRGVEVLTMLARIRDFLDRYERDKK